MSGAASEGRGPVPTFLVERYWPGVSMVVLEEAMIREGRSAAEMRREGRHIRYLRSVLVAADETVFCLFEAAERGDVLELNERADLPFDRIVEAVTLAPKAPAPRPLRRADAGSPVTLA